ncbi:MAG TPA: GGDEF domain-containing protein [Candidatus Nanoarchaeia archaeon]|nr:GGDEF domain-containing protein [Candidatus Nanoarchaeia archaeon]
MPAFVKTSTFESCMSKLSSELDAPVMLVSEEFLFWGALSFFQELRLRRDDKFSDVSGIKYARASVDGLSFITGPFRTSEVCSLDEELCDARANLPVWSASFENMVRIAIGQAVIAGKALYKNENELMQAKLLLEFLHTVGHLHEPNRLLSATAQFLVQKFRLSNAVIHCFGSEVRYFDSKLKASVLVEQRLVSQVKSSRTAFTVANISKDFLLDGIADRDKLPPCACVLPLSEGYTILYSENLPELSGISDVLKELNSILLRVTEYQKVQTSAVTDQLTGLYNRNHLVSSMDKLLPMLSSKSEPISVLLFDVDNFKNFNDTNGHPEGDRVLRAISDVIRSSMPQSAVSCRYGGEEFVIVLPGFNQEAAKQAAEKLRIDIEQSCPLTVSIGVMTCLNSSASRETLIREADRALYRAKHLGKNRVVPFIMLDRNLGVIDA